MHTNIIAEIYEKGIKISGIIETVSFCESSFEGQTSAGNVQITGNGLKMEKMNIEEKEVILSGEIISVYYPEKDIPEKRRKKGILG